jgi:hypothetical protein
LQLDGALHCIDGARKFDEQAVARRTYDASTELGDCGFDDYCAKILEASERSGFIGCHQTRIACHISGYNRCKPPWLPLHGRSSYCINIVAEKASKSETFV